MFLLNQSNLYNSHFSTMFNHFILTWWMVHTFTQIITALQWPFSSVPMVAVVEMLDCVHKGKRVIGKGQQLVPLSHQFRRCRTGERCFSWQTWSAKLTENMSLGRHVLIQQITNLTNLKQLISKEPWRCWYSGTLPYNHPVFTATSLYSALNKTSVSQFLT